MSSPKPQLQYDVNELPAEPFYGYWPSTALAATALSLFVVAALVVGGITEVAVRRGRRYRYMHLITLTGLMEAAGYIAMLYCIKNSSGIFSAYVAQQVFSVMSPNVIQACLYWTLGIVLKHCPRLVRGRKALRGWVVTTAFVLFDLLAVGIQAIGISIWATSKSSGTPNPDTIRTGCIITLAGLFIQLAGEALFLVLTVWVHRHPANELAGLKPTSRLFLGTYTVVAFLGIRNVFRVVEFFQATVLDWPPPSDTFVLSESEVLFYCLDTLPILICFAAYVIFHPSLLLPDPATAPDAASGAAADGSGAAQDDGGGIGTVEDAKKASSASMV